MDDQSLVEGLLRGDARAEEHLVKAYRRRLQATAVHFLGWRDAEVEDVVQESLAAALRQLRGFGFRSSFYYWLNHICVNHCLKRLEARNRLLLQQDAELEQLQGGGSASRLRRWQEDEQGRERSDWVRAAIRRLKPECRKALALRHLDDESYASIGRKLGLPLGTVMSRLARCREALKEALQALGGQP